MSSIATYLNQILRSIYGKDVRQAIHDAISECYNDVNAPALQTEAMEAAVQAKIDAGEMAALTIGDGTITTAKIADGAVTQEKLDPNISFEADAVLDETSTNAIQNKAVALAISGINGSLSDLIEPTSNKFNVRTSTVGRLNQASGAVRTNLTDYITTDWIEVHEGDKIIFVDCSDPCLYQSDKTFKSLVSGSPYFVPEGGAYIRASCNITKKDSAIINIGIADEYKPAESAVDINLRTDIDTVKSSVINTFVHDSVNIVPFFKNWYNHRILPNNGYLGLIWDSASNPTFLLSANSPESANDFPKGTVLNMSFNGGYAYIIYTFEAATRRIVDTYNTSNFSGGEIISNEDGLKIVVLMWRRDSANIDPSEGINAKGYVYDNDLKSKAIDFERRIEELESDADELFTVFRGKTAVLLGDSLTSPSQHYTKGWYEWVKELTGLQSYTNYGVSGKSISLQGGLCQTYTEMIDADLVLVMAGTNDCNKSVPFGTSADTGIDTLYGALNTLCSGLKAKYPTSIIVFITPHYQTKYPHSGGYTAMDVSRIMKEVCYKYAIPVYDNCQLSGIYSSNLNYYTTDNCHWNDTANEMVGKNLARWLIDTFRYIYGE